MRGLVGVEAGHREPDVNEHPVADAMGAPRHHRPARQLQQPGLHGTARSDGVDHAGRAFLDKLGGTAAGTEIADVWITAGRAGSDGDSVSITAATQPSIEDVVVVPLVAVAFVANLSDLWRYLKIRSL